MNSALSSLAANWRPIYARKFNRIGDIQSRVAEYYGLKVSDLRSGSHKPEIAAARAMAFLLCRRKGFSYPEIGTAFKCHHTTAVVAVGKMASVVIRHKSVAEDLEQLAIDMPKFGGKK